MFPQYPTNYLADGDGNVPPVDGGTVGTKIVAFDKTTTGGGTQVTLPAGATIIGFDLYIDTVFSGGTTTLSVGTTGNATKYLSAASVLGTQGPVFSTAWRSLLAKLSSPEPITITVGASNTAGAGHLVVKYVMQ